MSVHRIQRFEIGEVNGEVLVTISAIIRSGANEVSKVLSSGRYKNQAGAFRAIRDFCGSKVIEGGEELVTRVDAPAPPAAGAQADAPF